MNSNTNKNQRAMFFSIVNFTIFISLIMLQLGALSYFHSLLLDIIYAAFFILSTSCMAFIAVDYIGARMQQPDKLQIAATIIIVIGTAFIHSFGMPLFFPPP